MSVVCFRFFSDTNEKIDECSVQVATGGDSTGDILLICILGAITANLAKPAFW